MFILDEKVFFYLHKFETKSFVEKDFFFVIMSGGGRKEGYKEREGELKQNFLKREFFF